MGHKKSSFRVQFFGEPFVAVKIFAYKNRPTPLHKVPALVKIVFLFAFCIFTFWNWGDSSASVTAGESAAPDFSFTILSLSISAAFAILVFILGKGGRSSFSILKFVLVFGLFVVATRTFTLECNENGYKIALNYNGLVSGVLYLVRFFLAAIASQIIFETTSPLEIKDAMETLENAISKIIPPFKKLQFALVLALAINFIPEIFETWGKVRLAARARSPKKKNLSTTTRILTSEMIALLSILLHSAETKRKSLLNRTVM